MQLSISQAKFLHALKQKKYRNQHQMYVVEGEKMALEAIQHQAINIHQIVALEGWLTENQALLKSVRAMQVSLSESELKKISSLKTPNHVLIVLKKPQPVLDHTLLEASFSFYLDAIRDPGNLGTIIRIADWFGWTQLFISPDCVDPFNPKVLQASMGSVFRVAVHELSLEELLADHPGLPVLVAAMEGEDVFSSSLKAPGILVIGNESAGVSPAICQKATGFLSIPRVKNRQTESLNAGIAAGILCAALTKKSML